MSTDHLGRLRAPMYVPQLILLNDGPVTITTTKLNVQFDAVLNAFAGARIRRPTISAGYRHRRVSSNNCRNEKRLRT